MFEFDSMEWKFPVCNPQTKMYMYCFINLLKLFCSCRYEFFAQWLWIRHNIIRLNSTLFLCLSTLLIHWLWIIRVKRQRKLRIKLQYVEIIFTWILSFNYNIYTIMHFETHKYWKPTWYPIASIRLRRKTTTKYVLKLKFICTSS